MNDPIFTGKDAEIADLRSDVRRLHEENVSLKREPDVFALTGQLEKEGYTWRMGQCICCGRYTFEWAKIQGGASGMVESHSPAEAIRQGFLQATKP